MTPLSYIEIKLCQAPAKIFEASVSKTNCSSPIFIRRFVYSSIAKSFDEKVYLYRFDSITDALDIINEECDESKYGQIKYSVEQIFRLVTFIDVSASNTIYLAMLYINSLMPERLLNITIFFIHLR